MDIVILRFFGTLLVSVEVGISLSMRGLNGHSYFAATCIAGLISRSGFSINSGDAPEEKFFQIRLITIRA